MDMYFADMAGRMGARAGQGAIFGMHAPGDGMRRHDSDMVSIMGDAQARCVY